MAMECDMAKKKEIPLGHVRVVFDLGDGLTKELTLPAIDIIDENGERSTNFQLPEGVRLRPGTDTCKIQGTAEGAFMDTPLEVSPELIQRWRKEVLKARRSN
jgi:hypothetical protein